MMFFPRIRKAANSFAQPHCEFRDGFEALDGRGGKPVVPGEKQFGVAEDSGQRFIDFVAQNFSKITGRFVAWEMDHPPYPLSPAHATVEQAPPEGQRTAVAR